MRIIKLILVLFFINFSLLFSQDIIPDFLGKDVGIVVGDHVNVRKEPNLSSDIVFKQNIATKVIIITRSNKRINVDGKEGEWVYIDTRYYSDNNITETIKGWVFDYYISDLSNFKRMDNSNECYIEAWSGDYLFSLQINKDGTYKRKNYDEAKDNFYFTTGKLYKYRNVIFAKDDNNNTYNILYVNDKAMICNGRICATPGKRKDENIDKQK